MDAKIIGAIIGAAAIIIAALIGIIPKLLPENPVDVDQPELSISSPGNGDKVENSVEVKGSISRDLPKDRYMWLLTNPKACPNQWWPQNNGRITPVKGQWYAMAGIGGGEKDIDKEFVIAVALVNNKDDQMFVEWLKEGRETGNYSGIELPVSVDIIDQISVTLSKVQKSS